MLNSLRRKENYFDVNITSERLCSFDGTVVTNMYYGGCTCKCFKILEVTNLKKHSAVFAGIYVKLVYLFRWILIGNFKTSLLATLLNQFFGGGS
jgi:hypothetical protein